MVSKKTESEIFRRLAQPKGPVALASVVGLKGSSPGKPGFKMLVYPDGTKFGTVGGGAVEKLVIQECLASLKDRNSRLKEFQLSPKGTGMWCGGLLTIFIEPQLPPTKLWLFGYGNIGREVYKLTPGLDFDTRVVHHQEEEGVEVCDIDWQTLEPFPEVGAEDFVLVLTLDSEMELAILNKLNVDPPRYVGVIGSKGKAVKIRKRLKQDGVDADTLNLHMPLGVSIHARTPEEIAISISAELIKERNPG